MSTRASRSKKPVAPKYATIEQLHASLNSLQTSFESQIDGLSKSLFVRQEEMNQVGREHAETENAKTIVFMQKRHDDTIEVLKKESNTLTGINGAVTGGMNVMQQLPGLLRDQNKALWAIRVALGTLIFVVVATEVVIALAVLSLTHFK